MPTPENFSISRSFNSTPVYGIPYFPPTRSHRHPKHSLFENLKTLRPTPRHLEAIPPSVSSSTRNFSSQPHASRDAYRRIVPPIITPSANKKQHLPLEGKHRRSNLGAKQPPNCHQKQKHHHVWSNATQTSARRRDRRPQTRHDTLSSIRLNQTHR